MGLKSFNDMFALDVATHVKKKPTFKKGRDGQFQKLPEDKWLDYLEWAMVLNLLYQNGAEKVTYGSLENEKGYPAFYDPSGKNPFVKVWVDIDGSKYDIQFPVMSASGAGSATPSSTSIYNSHQRGFVKCVAINTGLGLSLWLKDEETRNDNPDPANDPTVNEELKKKNKAIVEMFEKISKRAGGSEKAHKLLGTKKSSMMDLLNLRQVESKDKMIENMDKWLSIDNDSFKSELEKALKKP